MRDGERGSALVEFAAVLGLLLMLALGAFEYGMAFRDWLSVTAATREGVRVGATAGDNTNADCIILEAAAGALHAVTSGEVAEVWIYESDQTGTVSANRQRYRPAQPADDPATLKCTTWFPLEQGWLETSRDNTGETRDWIGVRVVFDHAWYTGFLMWSGTARWQDDAVMHLEPTLPA